ncbi:Metallo-hydrolase/oxidoreductase [Xylariaceae sp. AK1471]|nr:Metallo-hydrolase/oxidoreductase [Xylariaceae sp. AK1471]
MASSTFNSSVQITYIGTATAILSIDGVGFLTDPYFSPDGTSWDTEVGVLTSHYTPALPLAGLPPIDAVLLSHEDHPDNLDELGRRLLDGRRVLTTPSGAQNLSPRPGVKRLAPWDTTILELGGRRFEITATPCQHLPGGECIGFLLSESSFGHNADGKPNVIYFSGDTVYFPELSNTIRERWHVSLALLNLGGAAVPVAGEDGLLQITMDGKQAAQLAREIGADVLVPMHYKGWNHFKESTEHLKKALDEGGVADKVVWLKPGIATKVL